MANTIKYTSRDYASVLSDLARISPSLSQAYDPQSENDPATFIMKNIAQMADVLSFYLDKRALETAPATMTERKVANNYYRMMGYYMDWYRPATSDVIIANEYIVEKINGSGYASSSLGLPKYTQFTSINGDVSAVLLEDVIIPGVSDGNFDSATGKVTIPGYSAPITLYEGTVVVEKANVINNRHELGPLSARMMIDSVEVREAVTLNTWTRVDDIDKYSKLDKVYDVYVDDYDKLYIRFSPYLSTSTIQIGTIRYISSRGVGASILSGSLVNARIKLPSIPASIANDYPNSNAKNLKVISSTLSTTSTLGPETPQEAYQNSQFYINTSDTLVTPLDYYNAIRRSAHITNCAVTDISTDPNVTSTSSSSSDSESAIDNPLKYKVRWVYDNFDYSVSGTSEVTNEINSMISANKHIRLNFEDSLVYFILTWQPTGTITLRESITKEESKKLLRQICINLASDYHPSKVQFGVGISLVELLDRIKSYDDRIMLVDLKPIQYKITFPESVNEGDADAAIVQLYYDYIMGEGNAPNVKNNINPNTGVAYTSNRHWTKYNVYGSDGVTNDSGIRINQYIPTNLSSTISSLATKVTNDPGPLTEDMLELDPSDFFHELHPYKNISIPRFANYSYYDGQESGPTGLEGFLKNVKINKENIL